MSGPGNDNGEGSSGKTRSSGMTLHEADVQKTRAWAGLIVVVGGDTVIALAAIFAVYKISSDEGAATALVSILTSAFTAIATMTSAYFGIRAASNTAQASISKAES